MIFLGIIVAILIFSVVILVHEYGHFKASRIFGVKVEEFGIGIPPKAKKIFTDKKDTIYTLNWLPLGGFVRLKGERLDDKSGLPGSSDFDEYLFNKPAWQASIIILAGVFMNFLLATVIFSILFFFGVKPIGINSKIPTNLDVKLIPTYQQSIKTGLLIKNPGILLYPVKNSIAEKAGIKEGDILTSIKSPHPNPKLLNQSPHPNPKLLNQSPHPNPLPMGEGTGKSISIKKVIKIISENSGKKLIFTIKRNSKIIKLPIIPLPLGEVRGRLGNGQTEVMGGLGKIGSYIGENIKINKNFEYKYSFFESIKYGSLETYNQSLLTFKAIGILVRKIFNPKTTKERQEAIQQMKGPIGMVDFISNSISAGLIFLIILGAIISINLGVFNLLPIPALDGGRFIFILINSIVSSLFGKKAINEKNENIINLVFFMFLIALSLLIAYNDISNIINK